MVNPEPPANPLFQEYCVSVDRNCYPQGENGKYEILKFDPFMKNLAFVASVAYLAAAAVMEASCLLQGTPLKASSVIMSGDDNCGSPCSHVSLPHTPMPVVCSFSIAPENGCLLEKDK